MMAMPNTRHPPETRRVTETATPPGGIRQALPRQLNAAHRMRPQASCELAERRHRIA